MDKPIKAMLFTSQTCRFCPSAKKSAKEYYKEQDDVDFEVHSVNTMEGQELAKEYDITSLPTLIIKGPGYPENIGLRGPQGETTLKKYTNLARGVEEEKKGFKIGKFHIKF